MIWYSTVIVIYCDYVLYSKFDNYHTSDMRDRSYGCNSRDSLKKQFAVCDCCNCTRKQYFNFIFMYF